MRWIIHLAVMSLVLMLAGCGSHARRAVAEIPDFCRYQQPVAACVVTDRDRFTVDIQRPLIAAAHRAGGDLSAAVRRGLDRIGELLPGPRVDILILDGTQVVPHTGVAGDTSPKGGAIDVTVDSHQSTGALRRTVRFWVLQALSHEVDHSVRIQAGPGCWPTLLDQMICEGVASAFDRQVQPALRLPWASALNATQERELWRRARPLLNHTGLYDQWFFGGDGVPDDTAYQIGYHIVRDYLNRHPEQTAATLTRTPARTVLAGSRYAP